MGKKEKKPSGEQQRRISTFNEYDRNV